VYVADTYNFEGTNFINTIRMIAPNGTVSSVAGNANFAGFYQEGIGTNAFFNGPLGLAVYVNGPVTNIYVADSATMPFAGLPPAAWSRASPSEGLLVTRRASRSMPPAMCMSPIREQYNLGNHSWRPGHNHRRNGRVRGQRRWTRPRGAVCQSHRFGGGCCDQHLCGRYDNNTIRKGTPYTAQTVMLKLDTLPSGFPVEANGTNYPATPQVFALATNTSVTVMATTSNVISFTNTVITTNNFIFTTGRRTTSR